MANEMENEIKHIWDKISDEALEKYLVTLFDKLLDVYTKAVIRYEYKVYAPVSTTSTLSPHQSQEVRLGGICSISLELFRDSHFEQFYDDIVLLDDMLTVYIAKYPHKANLQEGVVTFQPTYMYAFGKPVTSDEEEVEHNLSLRIDFLKWAVEQIKLNS